MTAELSPAYKTLLGQLHCPFYTESSAAPRGAVFKELLRLKEKLRECAMSSAEKAAEQEERRRSEAADEARRAEAAAAAKAAAEAAAFIRSNSG